MDTKRVASLEISKTVHFSCLCTVHSRTLFKSARKGRQTCLNSRKPSRKSLGKSQNWQKSNQTTKRTLKTSSGSAKNPTNEKIAAKTSQDIDKNEPWRGRMPPKGRCFGACSAKLPMTFTPPKRGGARSWALCFPLYYLVIHWKTLKDIRSLVASLAHRLRSNVGAV